MTALDIKDLSVFTGAHRLLGPVSFSLGEGDVFVVMGETGAGKSLIAQAILGTLPASLRMEGEIAINGRRVDRLPPAERALLWGREIATLPQEPWLALSPLMASWRQVAETHVHVGGRTQRDAKQATANDFVALGLEAAEPRLPGQLSGGMAQRVAFAAATAGRAPILLADEPTKGLDSDRRDKVVSLLRDVPDTGGTLLTITHEAFAARALGGRIMVLRHGNVVEQGQTLDVLTDPQADYTKKLLAADPSQWPDTPRSNPGRAILTAQDVALSRGDRVLVRGFNLTLHEGERVAITGPSGIGKSTLLDALAGLIKPVEGTIKRAAHLDRYSVQKLYQDPPAAFPRHVTLGRSLRDVADLHDRSWDEVMDTYGELGLAPDLLARTPDSVSGGELQRISIVRALTVRPKVLLADEPTSRLDPITQKDTLDLISRISLREGISVVLVTHDRAMVEAWADRVVDLSS
ncbi:ABC transporter ATP-binding protein [Lutimaribacter marinistellae]|uniref:ABC transporter ATP-binding protein n=1 Tax=Lutimaribacter marinistellae TaxID=1820329 RepID=A0ABV7TJF0_9RHOB